MKTAMVLDFDSVPVSLRSAWDMRPGLQPDVAVAHLAFDLGARRERRHRVDDEDVERARADEHVGDLEGLLPGVGLGDEQVVDVHADGAGVHGVHGVLGVDVGADPAVSLRLGHHVHGEGRLTRRLGSVDLDDASAGKAADPEREVERQRPGGDRLDPQVEVLPHPHDRAFAELLFDLAQCHVERLVAFHMSDASLRLIEPATSLRPDRLTRPTLRTGCDIPPAGDHRMPAV